MMTSTFDGHNIQPLGNMWLKHYTQRTDPVCSKMLDARSRGLGTLQSIPDETLVEVLLDDGFFDAVDLCKLGQVSRAWYVLLHAVDAIWRSLYVRMRALAGPASFPGAPVPHATGLISWRWVCANLFLHSTTGNASSPVPCSVPCTFQDDPYYSDYVFHMKRCATHAVGSHLTEDGALCVGSANRIPTLTEYTPEMFHEEYEQANAPVVLKGFLQHPTAGWSSLDASFGSKVRLHQTMGHHYPEHRFQCEALDLTWEEYQAYLHAPGLHGERPLYLFDPNVLRGVDLSTPYFRDDYFSLLGEGKRPQYRWLVVGPYRSGSSFHIDPNATSAWNVLLYGRKWWIMFPPDVQPPGVYPSPDGADVTAPTTLMEWMLNWYPSACATGKAVECVSEPGDLVFVPSRWWHMVLNLEESACITQNYVGRGNALAVLTFLRTTPRGITGFGGMDDDAFDEEHVIGSRRSLQHDFERALCAAHPEWTQYVSILEKRANSNNKNSSSHSNIKNKGTKRGQKRKSGNSTLPDTEVVVDDGNSSGGGLRASEPFYF